MKINFNCLVSSTFANRFNEFGKQISREINKRIHLVAAICFAALIALTAFFIRCCLKIRSEKKTIENKNTQKTSPNQIPNARTNKEPSKTFESTSSQVLNNLTESTAQNEVSSRPVPTTEPSDTIVVSNQEESPTVAKVTSVAKKRVSFADPLAQIFSYDQVSSEEDEAFWEDLDEEDSSDKEVPLVSREEQGQADVEKKVDDNQTDAEMKTPQQLPEEVEAQGANDDAVAIIDSEGLPPTQAVIMQEQILPTPVRKKSISEKLVANLDLAQEQQYRQLDGMELSDDLDPMYVQVKMIKNPMLGTKSKKTSTLPIHASAFTLAGREVGVASCRINDDELDLETTYSCTEITFSSNGKEIKAQLYSVFGDNFNARASKFVKENIQTYMEHSLTKHAGEELTHDTIYGALKEAFIMLDKGYDEEWISNWGSLDSESAQDGACVTAALAIEGELFVANAGVNRTILSYQGGTMQLSEDAEPSMERYKKTIRKRGGEKALEPKGIFWPFARAIGYNAEVGDTEEKLSLVSPNPKITLLTEPCLTGLEDKYLVLANSGLYQMGSTDDVGNAIQQMTNEGTSPETMAKRLIHSAVTAGARGSVSVVVVKLS